MTQAVGTARQAARTHAAPLRADPFRVAFEDAPVGVAIAHAEEGLVYVNRAMSDLLGRGRDEINAATYIEATHPDDRDATEARVNALLAGETDTYVSETRLVHPDGEVVWARIHVAATRDRAGTITYVVAHAEDVSEQRRTEHALHASEDRFRAASEASLDAFVILEACRDLHGAVADFRLTDANQHVRELFGRPREKLLGKLVSEHFPAGYEERLLDRYVRVLESGIPETGEYPVSNPDVRASWLREQIVPIGDGIAITWSNVSELKETELALRESEARFRTLLRNSTDVVMIVDDESVIQYASPAVESVLGYAPETFREMNPFDLLHPDDRRAWVESWASLARAPKGGFTFEARALHADGGYRWFEATFRNVTEEPTLAGHLVHFHDITERHRAQDALVHKALHDDLTGLPNRVLLTDRLGHALNRVERSPDTLVAVLFLDLDRFKQVNDAHGHAVGDALLVEVGERLRAAVRPADTVARLGGDEFVVVCEDLVTDAEAVMLADRVLEDLRAPFAPRDHDVKIGASIGIALSGRGAETPEALLRDADAAMYVAKGHGRGRLEVYDDGLRMRLLQRLDTESDLHRAVDGGQLLLHWQPTFSLATDATVGVEALVRWTHPDRGLLLPGEFLDVAADAGLDNRVADWVLEAACAQARQWRNPGADDGIAAPVVWVNVSSQQLVRADFLQQVATALATAGISARDLGFELPESALIDADRIPEAAHNLTALADLGCRLAIDDYGSGYSSLGSLRRYSIDTLKIDAAMIDRPDGTEIVSAVASLAGVFGIDLTAKGVETAEQLDRLARAGCTAASGYLLGRPKPAPEHLLP